MKVLLVSVDSKYIHLNLAVHSLKAYAESQHAALQRRRTARRLTAAKGDIQH